MKSTLTGLSTLAVCASFLMPAHGADDLIKPASFGWFRNNNPPPPPPRPAFYAPASNPCCQPACPQTTCTQQYTLQSYYQAVTTYQTQTQYEPVTTYQTSYYYEPVTTYRSSCYYCPTTCSYKQVQVPETQYQLRSRCCPVQSYQAKCVQVPVTSYQKAYYYQPQTVCTQSPPPCCPAPAAPCCQPGVTMSPSNYAPQASASPGLAPPMNPPQASASPGMAPPMNPPQASASPGYTPPIILDKDMKKDSYNEPPRIPSPPPPPNGGTSWQPASPVPAPSPPPSAPPAHTVRLERVILGADALVEGELVHADRTPRANTKILLVNANQPNLRETVTTNQVGRFQVTLAAGGWLVYIYNLDGEALYHSRIEVSDEQTMGRIVLVNR